MDNLFRFVTVRSAQRIAGQTGVAPVNAYDADNPSALHSDLKDLRDRGDAIALRERALSHMASDRHVSRLGDLALAFAELDAWFVAAKSPPTVTAVTDTVADIFGEAPGEVAAKEEFALDRTRLRDSVLALVITGKSEEAGQALVRGVQLAAVLEYVGVAQDATQAGITDRLRAVVRLPADVFPVPSLRSEHDIDRHERREKEKRRVEAVREQRAALISELERAETAIGELREAFSLDISLSVISPGPRPGDEQPHAVTIAAATRPSGEPEDPGIVLAAVAPPAAALLSEKAAGMLSPGTVAAIETLGFAPDKIDVPAVATALERRNAVIAADLFRDTGKPTAAPVGGNWVRAGDFGRVYDPDVGGTRVPGACDPADPESPSVEATSVPEGVGTARPLGVSDLMLVRQRIKRYELGEVAHIENVLRGELKERTHRRARSTAVTTVSEREEVEQSERDLQSTERYELQIESERALSQDTHREAGVTVSASYGPFVDVTANAGFASDTAREESHRNATSFSRDVTERAVSKLQLRVREQRTRVTVEEFEERNVHRLNNETASENVAGVYRWVDKIFDAEVLNYGRRMMVEAIVPEPGALYRHLLSTKPIEGVSVERPIPPGYCVNGREFVPLSPRDISRTSYIYWVGKYHVPNAEPPPPTYKIVATAFDEPFTTTEPQATAKSSKELEVPAGYVAKQAWLSGNYAAYNYAPESGRRAHLLVYVGRHLVANHAPLNDEDETIPIAILTAYVLAYAITVEVRCELTHEAFQDWQLRTYASIITAYEEQQAAYDNQVAASLAEDSGRLRAGNPLVHRDTERTELKRAALSTLTGQHFDAFDAMRRGVPPQGFPQADLAEADAEGRFVQFFEQAFEWEHMTYLFYPYFWTRKDEWPALLRLADDDLVFMNFLRAGSARVLLPVRPGYEPALLGYLGSGQIWEGGDPPVLDDPLYISIVDEVKHQTGAVFLKSDGRVSIAEGSTAVAGVGTNFADDDVDREMRIGGSTYRIATVGSSTELDLDRPYGATATELRYAIGPKLVGLPWEVRVPTTLIHLQADASLPDWDEADQG